MTPKCPDQLAKSQGKDLAVATGKKARAGAMSPERRAEIAQKAAEKRWKPQEMEDRLGILPATSPIDAKLLPATF